MTAGGRAETAAQVLGGFVARAREQAVPDDVSSRAGEILLDCLGVALAGTEEPVSRAVRDLAVGGRAEATLLGHPTCTSAAEAALANGTAAHALDYDDVQQPWYGHPTAVLLPALLAVAEQRGSTGRELVTAYLAGLAVGDTIGAQLNTGHYERGWHPTATLGTLAAAAGCALLTGADAAGAAAAIGIAASTAGGLRENFGSDVKALHAGLAARNGVLAAELAARGVRASASSLDGRFGLAAVLGGGDLDAGTVRDRLQEGLEAPLRRVGLKRYPACAAAHPAVDAVLALREEHGIAPAEVVRVECRVEPLAVSLLRFDRPSGPQEAKFSLQHCVAAALLDGELGLRQFEQGRVGDPAVADLRERVTVVADPAIRSTGDFPSAVVLTLDGGRVLRRHVDQAVGKPRRPLETGAVLAKFRSTAATAGPAAVAVGEELLSIQEQADVRQWTERLRRACRPAGQRDPDPPFRQAAPVASERRPGG